jgi:hypothetical protein
MTNSEKLAAAYPWQRPADPVKPPGPLAQAANAVTRHLGAPDFPPAGQPGGRPGGTGGVSAPLQTPRQIAPVAPASPQLAKSSHMNNVAKLQVALYAALEKSATGLNTPGKGIPQTPAPAPAGGGFASTPMGKNFSSWGQGIGKGLAAVGNAGTNAITGAASGIAKGVSSAASNFANTTMGGSGQPAPAAPAQPPSPTPAPATASLQPPASSPVPPGLDAQRVGTGYSAGLSLPPIASSPTSTPPGLDGQRVGTGYSAGLSLPPMGSGTAPHTAQPGEYTQDQLRQFKRTNGHFNANSSMDRWKMQQMLTSGNGSSNQDYQRTLTAGR